MYLTRITLDRRNPSVRQGLRDCGDMHRNIMSLFKSGRRDAGVLYRLRLTDERPTVYILSKEAPSSPPPNSGMRLEGTRDVSAFPASFSRGQQYSFDLLAVPAKKVKEAGIKNSRRRVIRTVEEREHWLRRKAEQNGFEILWLREDGAKKQYSVHTADRGGPMYIDSVHFCGLLRVTDPVLFSKCWENGLGAGKAFGCGMLLLAGARK